MTASMPQQRRFWLEWLLVSVYLAMVVVGVAFHEPWRDEWRAWMISALVTSPGQLFTLLSSEGHPWLWYAVLKPFTLWPGGQAGLALAGLATGVMGSLVLFFGFRLPLWIRTGVLFSVYWLVEYVLISRNYGLAFAFTSFGILAAVRGQRWLLAALLIGLGAHTHVIVALTSLPLIALLAVWGRSLPGGRRLLALGLALVLTFGGIAAAIGPGAFSVGQRRLAAISRGAVPANAPKKMRAAPVTPADEPPASPRAFLRPAVGVGLILVVLAGLWQRSRVVVMIYALPALFIPLFFNTFVHPSASARHQGPVFMVLVYALILAAEDPTARATTRSLIWLQRPWLSSLRRSRLGVRCVVLALSLILLFASADGLRHWIFDVRAPFSGVPQAAAYLRQNNIAPEQIVPMTSVVDESLAIALQPEAPIPGPIGRMRPYNRPHWKLSEAEVCQQAVALRGQLQLPIAIVVLHDPQGSPDICSGLPQRSHVFGGLREGLKVVEILPD